MVLGDAEETVTTVEIDEETYEEVYKTTKRTIPMLFVRGDGVILGLIVVSLLLTLFCDLISFSVTADESWRIRNSFFRLKHI